MTDKQVIPNIGQVVWRIKNGQRTRDWVAQVRLGDEQSCIDLGRKQRKIPSGR